MTCLYVLPEGFQIISNLSVFLAVQKIIPALREIDLSQISFF